MLLTGCFAGDLGFSEGKDLSSLFSEAAVKAFALLRADSSGIPGGNGKWEGALRCTCLRERGR